MLKNEIIFGVLGSLFVIIMTVFYAGQYTFNQNKTANLIQTNLVQTNKFIPASTSSNSGITLSHAEVGKHKLPTDCWMIINGNVYNVSNFDTLHPGGASQIDAYCGTDATQAFLTRGGTGMHSSRADQELSQMLLGKLNENITTQKIDNTKNNVQNIQSGSRFGEDE